MPPVSFLSQADENDQLQVEISVLQQQLLNMRQQLLAVKASHDSHTPLPSVTRQPVPEAAVAESEAAVAAGSWNLALTPEQPSGQQGHALSHAGCQTPGALLSTPKMSGLDCNVTPRTGSRTPPGALLSMTPPECQAMLEAVEDAMQLVAATPHGRETPSR